MQITGFEDSQTATGTITFREIQQFRQVWIWILLLPAFLFGIGLFSYGMVKQLVLGQPWGSRPMSDTALRIMGPLVILFEVGFLYLFRSMKLVTEVRDYAVS